MFSWDYDVSVMYNMDGWMAVTGYPWSSGWLVSSQGVSCALFQELFSRTTHYELPNWNMQMGFPKTLCFYISYGALGPHFVVILWPGLYVEWDTSNT